MTRSGTGERRRAVGVILAGGIGTRLGLPVPKQLIKVAGRTILEHTIAAFDRSPSIDEIVVMITPGWEDHVREIVAGSFDKVTAVLAGGETRNETTRIALDAVGDPDTKLVLHDAVRPLVDERILSACVEGLAEHDALDVVIHSADTLVEVDEDDFIVAIPDRGRYRRGQTPQAFRLGVLREAYELAEEDPGFRATDDCGVVARYLPHVAIKTIVGSESNIKVTYPLDLVIADRLFQLGSHASPDRGDDERGDALDGRVVVVFGGTSGIGAEIARLAADAGAVVVSHGRTTTGADISDDREVLTAIEDAARQHGRIDAVVVTAGVLHVGDLADTDERTIAESIGTNLLGPVWIARAAQPHLASTGGSLLFFTSSSYTRGRRGYALYSSTKAAIVNLTQALADEWADDGVRVNVLNPERTATPMRTAAFGDEDPDSLLSAHAVASASLDVLVSDATGMVFDVRRTA